MQPSHISLLVSIVCVLGRSVSCCNSQWCDSKKALFCITVLGATGVILWTIDAVQISTWTFSYGRPVSFSWHNLTADSGSNLLAQILKVCIKISATFLPINYQISPYSQNNTYAINWKWPIQFYLLLKHTSLYIWIFTLTVYKLLILHNTFVSKKMFCTQCPFKLLQMFVTKATRIHSVLLISLNRTEHTRGPICNDVSTTATKPV